MTSRPGWSVARLARESGLHRSAIFGWIKDGAEGITIRSVYLIADALGVDRAEALSIAGGIQEGDPEVDLILASDRTEREKALMIDRLMQRREEERERRLADLRWMLGVNGDQDQGQAAG